MSYLVKTNGLTKEYKNTLAVSEANLTIMEGSIYGLIGRNGAGKTTILKLISGLIKPTKGQIEFANKENQNRQYSCADVGVLIEVPGLFGNMTAFENLKAKFLCCGKNATTKEINYLLELVGLESTGKKKTRNFSLGMKQRLGIALALVGEPKLLILDEPINGLDPQGIIEVRNLIVKLSKEKGITIIISSHILDELAKIATDFCIIDAGVVLYEMSKEQLLELCGDTPLDEYYVRIIGGR